MPDSSLGVYTRPSSPTPVTGQGADAPQVNVPVDDMAAALNRRSFRDGRAPMLGDQDYNGYKVTGAADGEGAQDYVTLSQVQSLIASIQGIPVGALVPMTGALVPAGFLAANGQTVSRSTYAALWAYAQASSNLAATQIAKTDGQYGPGDGASTFSLPKIVDFLRGLDTGRTIGSSQADDLKSHLHTATFAGTAVANHTHGVGGTNSVGAALDSAVTSVGRTIGTMQTDPAGGFTPAGTVTVAANGGTETRPKNIAYPYVIRT